ncbi:hypothetical protein LQZ19_07510 [Treponema primitia]|uniref:hypothetical protein n=1 Tax=Treponema primitia TaxID=88058 RepID=UPI003980A550
MRRIAVLLLVCYALPLWAQENLGEGNDRDPNTAIGLTLAMVYARFGIPESVYAVRGAEEWQDDVVFVYNDWDLYIYRDRVWQLGLKSAYGINLGDPGGVVSLTLGEGVQAYTGYLLYPLPSRSWPLQLRINLDAAGKVAAIFIYRSDF